MNKPLQKSLLSDVIKQYKRELSSYKLPVVLGIDEQGKVRFADLVDLQHILMAGTTGSGKSVFGHSMIATLLRLLPADYVQFLIIDMKRVEFSGYKGLSQLLTHVLVDYDEVFANLERLFKEKERRLKDNNTEYPYIIVIVDTFSDLMWHDQIRFENSMARLIPNAVRAKIHVVMYDSRSSVEVFTSIIKNNFPTRISFNLSEADYGLVILDSNTYGAEKLLGRGDMLFFPQNLDKPVRIQAPYLTDNEIDDVKKSLAE